MIRGTLFLERGSGVRVIYELQMIIGEPGFHAVTPSDGGTPFINMLDHASCAVCDLGGRLVLESQYGAGLDLTANGKSSVFSSGCSEALLLHRVDGDVLAFRVFEHDLVALDVVTNNPDDLISLQM